MHTCPLAFRWAAGQAILLLFTSAAAELAVRRCSRWPVDARARPFGLARFGFCAAALTVVVPVGPRRIDVKGRTPIGDLFFALSTAPIAGDAFLRVLDQTYALADCRTRHTRIGCTLRTIELPFGPIPVDVADGRREGSRSRTGGRSGCSLGIAASVASPDADHQRQRCGEPRECDQHVCHSFRCRPAQGQCPPVSGGRSYQNVRRRALASRQRRSLGGNVVREAYPRPKKTAGEWVSNGQAEDRRLLGTHSDDSELGATG